MKKKSLLAVLLVACTVGLASCQIHKPISSGSTTPSQPSSTPSSKVDEKKLEISISGEAIEGQSVNLVASYDGSPVVETITYTAIKGADLVTIAGNKVTLNGEGEVEIKGDVTIDGVAVSGTVTITIAASPIMSITEAKQQEAGTTVTVRGKVTLSGGTSAYISDGTDGIYVYNWSYISTDTAISNKAFTVGDNVEIKANIAAYGGAMQLSNYSSGRIEGTYAYKITNEIDAMTPIQLDETTYAALSAADSGKLYTFDAVYKSGEPASDKVANIVFTIGNTDVTLRTNGSSSKIYDQNINGLIANWKALNLVAGNSVTITTALSWYNKAQFAYYGYGTTITKNYTGKVSVSSDSTNVVEGKTIQLNASVDAASPSVTWSSSDESIATVDQNGLVTGVKEGTVTITAVNADYSAQSDSITITVSKNVIPTESVTFTNDTDTLKIDDKMTLATKVSPDTATYKEVEYSIVSGSEYATLEDGVLTGVAIGDVVVKASVKNTEISAEKTFHVLTDVQKLSEIVSLDKGTKIKSRGVYMGHNNLKYTYNGTEQWNAIFVADGNVNYMLYQVTASLLDNLGDLVVGQSVLEFEGTTSNYTNKNNFTTYEAKVTSLKVVTDETVTAPAVVELNSTTEKFENNQANVNKKVKLVGAQVKSIEKDSYSSLTITLTLGANEYKLYLDNRYNDISVSAIANLKVNDIINVNTWSADGQFIYANDFEVTGTSNIPATAVAISADTNEIKIGETVTLSATLTPSDSTSEITYELQSGSEYVTLDASNGIVTGVVAGSATIIAKAGDVTSNPITITVTSEVSTETTVTMKYPGGGTSTNMKDGNNAESVGLDASLFNVVGRKCSTSNNVGLNKDGTIRLYNLKNSIDGCELEVTLTSGNIEKIVLNIASTGKSTAFTVNGTEYSITASKATVIEADINSTSFVIKNTVNASGGAQLHFSSIEITYSL